MSAAATRATGKTALARRPGGRTARVRQAVFDATLGQVSAHGYRALTIDGVAAAAGVNKTTIYRNWPTKAALVLAAAEERSEALVTTTVSGDAERDLVAFLRSVADNVTSPLGQALVIATLNESDDPQVRRIRDQFWQARFDAAASMLRAVSRDARLDAETTIEHMIGPLFLRVFITGAPIDDAFIRRTARAALRLMA